MLSALKGASAWLSIGVWVSNSTCVPWIWLLTLCSVTEVGCECGVEKLWLLVSLAAVGGAGAVCAARAVPVGWAVRGGKPVCTFYQHQRCRSAFWNPHRIVAGAAAVHSWSPTSAGLGSSAVSLLTLGFEALGTHRKLFRLNLIVFFSFGICIIVFWTE